MIARDSKAVSFDTGQRASLGTPQVRVQGGSAAITVEAGRQITEQWKQNLVAGLAEKGTAIGQRMFKNATEEGYMQGQIAATAGKSEEELQADPLTRDWAVAGFRDTMGKMKQAELATQFQTDLPTLRQQSPAALAQYLENMRGQLLPQVEGMSREQRQSVLGSQMTFEQAAVKLHTAEHRAWIVEETNASISADAAPKLAMLQSAQSSGDVGAAQAAVEHAATFAVTSILLKPQLAALPKERSKIMSQYIAASLDQNTPALYDYFRDNKITVSGKEVSVLSTLPLEEQAKLSRKYVEAKSAVKNQEHSWWFQQNAEIAARMETDGVSPVSGEQYRAFLDYGVRNGVVPASSSGSMWEAFLKNGYATENQNALASMAMRGDTPGIAQSGKTTQDALQSLDKMLNRNKVPVQDRMTAYLQAGQNGLVETFAKLGGLASVPVMQLGSKDGKIDTAHIPTLERLNGILDSANPSVRAQVYSGMSDEAQMRLQRMRAFRADGANPEMALAKTLELEHQELNMTPQAKAARNGATAVEDRKAIQQVDGVGVLRNIGLAVSGTWNPVDAARRIISPRDTWTGNTTLVQEYASTARAELAADFSKIGLIRPGATADDKMELATARLAARTVRTEFGPVFLPQGRTTATAFNLPAAVPNEVVAEAINTVFKDTKAKGNGVAFSFMGGQLKWQEVDAKGNYTSQFGTIDPSAIKDAIGLREQQQRKGFDERSGTGKMARGDGIALNYNGENGAGVGTRIMLQFRDNLVKNEGVKGKVYPDELGVRTIGVGVSERSSFWPKSINPTRAELEVAFSGASSEAAAVGAKLQTALGLKDDSSFLLLSELAYHSGPNFHTLKPYQEFLSTAMRARVGAANLDDVVSSFKQTKAYEVSAPSRRQHYIGLIQQAMKG